MTSIGNISDARMIHRWVNEADRKYGRSERAWQEEAPEGWEFLGSGCFRSVWRSPEGIAYKVQHGKGSSQSNEEEYDNLQRASRCEIPEGVRLPAASLYEVGEERVIAMEAISGSTLGYYGGDDRWRYYSLMHACEAAFRLEDLHDENVKVDEGGYLVVVDFGG